MLGFIWPQHGQRGPHARFCHWSGFQMVISSHADQLAPAKTHLATVKAPVICVKIERFSTAPLLHRSRVKVNQSESKWMNPSSTWEWMPAASGKLCFNPSFPVVFAWQVFQEFQELQVHFKRISRDGNGHQVFREFQEHVSRGLESQNSIRRPHMQVPFLNWFWASSVSRASRVSWVSSTFQEIARVIKCFKSFKSTFQEWLTNHDWIYNAFPIPHLARRMSFAVLLCCFQRTCFLARISGGEKTFWQASLATLQTILLVINDVELLIIDF